MRFIIQIISTLSLLLLNSCQPIEMGVPSLFGTVAYPIVQLKEAFEKDSDDFYEQTIKDREVLSKEEEALKCQSEGLPLTDDMKKILEKVNLNQCVGCEPLVTPACRDKSCNCSTVCPDWCERVCPDNFEILKQSRKLAIPYKENNLAVINWSSEFGDPVIFGGYCNGITLLTKRMTALGVFRPEKKPTEKDPGLLRAYYEKIFHSLYAGKVTEIPASSIFEFTNDPIVMPLMKDAIRAAWSQSNFYNPWLAESAGVLVPISEGGFLSAKSDIDKMIEMTGSAQVTLSMNDNTGAGSGHTVEVYKTYEEKVGDFVMTMACINDSYVNRKNYKSKKEWMETKDRWDSAPDGTYCPEKLLLKRESKGKTEYLRNIKVDNMDKRILVDHIEALSARCKKDQGCE